MFGTPKAPGRACSSRSALGYEERVPPRRPHAHRHPEALDALAGLPSPSPIVAAIALACAGDEPLRAAAMVDESTPAAVTPAVLEDLGRRARQVVIAIWAAGA